VRRIESAETRNEEGGEGGGGKLGKKERERGKERETRGRKLGVAEIYATATSDLSFTSI